ncbi:MAG: hypothetical protein OEM97_04995 [Acidimicrobiia bacterium]|nr:hypothetical protein [Acidimicrobiia bacterium]
MRRLVDCQGTDSVLVDYAMTDVLQPPLMAVVTIIAPAAEVDAVADQMLANWFVTGLSQTKGG